MLVISLMCSHVKRTSFNIAMFSHHFGVVVLYRSSSHITIVAVRRTHDLIFAPYGRLSSQRGAEVNNVLIGILMRLFSAASKPAERASHVKASGSHFLCVPAREQSRAYD